MMRNRRALLAALAVDNFGSGPSFQYAFTVPGVIAPGVVALFSVAVWLPWLLVGAGAALAAATLPWLAGRLPAEALRPGTDAPPGKTALRGRAG